MNFLKDAAKHAIKRHELRHTRANFSNVYGLGNLRSPCADLNTRIISLNSWSTYVKRSAFSYFRGTLTFYEHHLLHSNEKSALAHWAKWLQSLFIDINFKYCNLNIRWSWSNPRFRHVFRKLEGIIWCKIVETWDASSLKAIQTSSCVHLKRSFSLTYCSNHCAVRRL